MVSRIIKGAALGLATTAFATAASATCGGNYCTSSHGSMAPHGAWSAASGAQYSLTLPDTYNPSASYSSVSSYTTSSSYGGVMSQSEADMKYGTGSISNAYTGGDVEMYGFSGSTSGLAGLGYNESLQATNCPTNVYNPEGARVLGCYNVVKPVPQTNYVRVVRPIIYVRYPVPVAVPTYSACNVMTHYSRYGGYSWYQGLDGYGRRCGW